MKQPGLQGRAIVPIGEKSGHTEKRMSCEDRKTDAHIHRGRRPCVNRGRGCRHVSIGQGMPRTVQHWWLGEAWDRISPRASRKANSVDTLISDFRPPRLWEDKFLLFEAPVCGTLWWQPQEVSMNTLQMVSLYLWDKLRETPFFKAHGPSYSYTGPRPVDPSLPSVPHLRPSLYCFSSEGRTSIPSSFCHMQSRLTQWLPALALRVTWVA